ncbi:MAG: ECF transporter S component [Clostridia bacterium]|nr:ECF transporter S component [Clostridia bacterium]
MTQATDSTRRLTLTAMLAAMAYVAMLITRPLPHVAGFLSYDLKDVVVAIAGFQLGVVPALLITLVVSLLEMVTVSTTGPIGLLMNVLSTGAFVLPAAIMYQRSKKLKSAAVGLTLGVLLMTALMLAWNYIITPLYMNVPRSVVAGMLIPTFLPFNLVKGGLNAGITMLIYKPVTDALRRAGLLAPSASGNNKRAFNLPATLCSAFVVVTCVAVLVLMSR